MLKFGNKEFRNLEEQVAKNQSDIGDLRESGKTLASFGIKVIGQIASASELPSSYSGDYGDAYIVGDSSDPDAYEYYIWTRGDEAHWVNIGHITQTGPTGPQGPALGVGSITTSTLGSGSKATVSIIADPSDGTKLNFYFGVPQGEKGEKGDQGQTGPQGIQGKQGDKGDKGDTGEVGPTAPLFHIVGVLETAADLPLPTEVKDLTVAYLIVDDENRDYDLYVQIGATAAVAKWTNIGHTSHTINWWERTEDDILVPDEGTKQVQIKNLTVLNETHLSSPHISGVINGSAIASPSTLTLSGTTDAEVLVNGATIAKYQTDGMYLPTLYAPTDNVSYAVAMADSSGKLLKANSLSYNPASGALSTKTLTTGGATINGKASVNGEMVFTQSSTYTANSCNILLYNGTLHLGDYKGNGICISQMGTNSSLIKQTPHKGDLTYTLPSSSGTLALTTDVPAASSTLKGGTRTASGTATPSELGTAVNSRMYYNGAIKQSITNTPLPNGIPTDFTMSTQTWDNSGWATQVAYFQADSNFNQSGLAIRTIGVGGDTLWTDKSDGGWCFLANRNTDNTFSGTNAFTGKTYVNTGIGNSKLGADYLNSESKIGYDVPLDAQEAVVYRITSCSDNDGSCELSLLTSAGGGSVYSSAIGTLCEKFGNPFTIVMNQDGVYINRNQVAASSATRYMQIAGNVNVPIIIEQLI
jgi:hypothetical protein